MAYYKAVSPEFVAQAILKANGKLALNNTGSLLPAYTVCAWTNTGQLQKAEADVMTADRFAGIVHADIASGVYGLVLRSGKVPGALTSLAAVAGQPVFLSKTAGQMTLSTAGFDPGDAIVRVGFAEPPDGSSGLATDLLIEFELVLG